MVGFAADADTRIETVDLPPHKEVEQNPKLRAKRQIDFERDMERADEEKT